MVFTRAFPSCFVLRVRARFYLMAYEDDEEGKEVLFWCTIATATILIFWHLIDSLVDLWHVEAFLFPFPFCIVLFCTKYLAQVFLFLVSVYWTNVRIYAGLDSPNPFLFWRGVWMASTNLPKSVLAEYSDLASHLFLLCYCMARHFLDLFDKILKSWMTVSSQICRKQQFVTLTLRHSLKVLLATPHQICIWVVLRLPFWAVSESAMWSEL